MNEYIEWVNKTPLKLYMQVFYLSHNDRHYDQLVSMGQYEKLPRGKGKDRQSNYACLLGIYAYHLQAAKLNEYVNAQTFDEMDNIFEEIELLFIEEYDVEFSYNPFRLCTWPPPIKEKFLKAKTDVKRKAIALEALQGAIV